MGVVANQRSIRPGSAQENLPTSSSSSGYPSNSTKKKCSNLMMPICVALVVLAEIAFLGRLDMAKNAMIVNSWIDSSFTSLSPIKKDMVVDIPISTDSDDDLGGLDVVNELESCEKWLEREDSIEHLRDFGKDPIRVSGGEQEWKSCAVGCKFGYNSDKKLDAAFGIPQQAGTASVLRSMESAQYYAENNLDQARRWVSTIQDSFISKSNHTPMPKTNRFENLSFAYY